MAGYPPPGAPWPTPRPSGYGYGYGGATSYGTHEGPYRTQEGPYRTQEGPYRTQEGQYGIPSAPPYGGPPPNSGRPPGSFGDLGNTPYQADYLSSTTPSGYPPSGYTRPGFTGYPVATQMWESGSPFGQLLPSAFAPGTDPIIIAYFEAADRDRSGFIDDKELQAALSHSNHNFSMRTVRLLMCHQNGRPTHKIGPKEFTSLYYNLQKWREIFEGCDRDRSGKLDVNELRDALSKIGCAVSPTMLSLLVSKYDHMGGINKAINYDNFIDCCLIVKGLTDKFKERDNLRDGNATFDYESFMMSVLPFLIA